MTKIIMKAEYLNSLAQQIEQVTAQLQQVDGALQRSIQGAAWQSGNRQTIIGLYQTHQQRFQNAGENMQQLAAFVKTTRERMEQEDQSGGTFGLTGINPFAPFDGPGSTVGTLTGAAAVARLGYRVKNGFMVKPQLDRNTPRILVRESYDSVKDNKIVNGRPRDYKIHYVRDIEAKLTNGTATPQIKEIASMVKPGYAVKSALTDKLGWASVGIDVFADTQENISHNATSDKIAGDIIGNVVVGGATTVGATLLTAAILPAAAPVLAVGAVGLGVSVGLTYLAEGVTMNMDLDGDGKDDSVKDVVKHGAKKAWSTVAGWFK
ncbi:hypothetical protein QP794_26080 [Paenibacillus sp. UMB7766-LJ446]|uniref:hypothetical protein n=1 Tax=Paenibacillus sp. UMB7766-LJ446 TaxID=3046313 RepID=UPI0025513AFC|nr:hypothetical protein [Paenibacillus sp. UMB7766-LJ446]MDK8193554.1 hypothetical protein [Paenibacillus sp. UMB7766-LJ446]